MHRILLLSLLVSLLWGVLSLVPYLTGPCGWPLSLALMAVVVIDVFWGVATVYVIDLFNSHYRNNNEFLRSFYAELHADLIAVLVLAGVLFVIFSMATPGYALSNIDIACLGLPLFINAIDALARAKDPVGILRLNMGQRLFLMSVPAAMLVLSSWILIRIYSGQIPAAASLWLQLNIIAAGFSAYVSAKQVSYFLTHRKMGVSPTLEKMFAAFRGGRPGPYDHAKQLAEKFERDMKKATAQAAAGRRQSRKRSKPRRK
ncbi:hypothetical protein [Pseudoxanthomonas sp. PXM02]|uniref:hypothetical protein n=1 Tax=Pseudoxanthomonas sp. PXM02 TaxID=2769294 RepID=UPI00177AD920|nr:hypothetical protein [Pseudoxanthomonas sp. PXM02]MBD9477398.1 hypothetical protein [Pseudoxanthomonas sp. PXM02]